MLNTVNFSESPCLNWDNNSTYCMGLLWGLKLLAHSNKNLKNLFTQESWNKKHALVSSQLETRVSQLKFFSALHISLNDFKSIPSIDLGVTDKFWQEVNLQVWILQIMRVNCVNRILHTTLFFNFAFYWWTFNIHYSFLQIFLSWLTSYTLVNILL